MKVSDECVEIFNRIKLKQDLAYIIYHINKDAGEIQILETGPKGEDKRWGGRGEERGERR